MDEVKYAIVSTYVKVANEMGIPHELQLIDGEWSAVPIDQMSAALKQFGSASLGIKAEFWAEKVQLEVERRLK